MAGFNVAIWYELYVQGNYVYIYMYICFVPFVRCSIYWYVPIYLSICLSIYLFIYLSIYLSIYVSMLITFTAAQY